MRVYLFQVYDFLNVNTEIYFLLLMLLLWATLTSSVTDSIGLHVDVDINVYVP